MAKIAIDARESGTSTGRYIDRLIQYLHTIDTKSEIVVITKAHRVDFIKSIAPKFQVIECSYKEFSLGEQLGYKKQLRSIGADLVHFGMVQQPILYRGKSVTTMHDLITTRFRNPSKNWLLFTVKQQVYKFVNWYVPRHSQKVIVPTKFVKDDVVNFSHVSPSKFVVTYESADAITDKPEPISELKGKEFLFYIGRPTPHKNLLGLVNAFEQLQKEKPELKLVLAGKKDSLFEELENQVKRRGIKGVVFVGFVSEGQLRWLYENCRAYVFPSFSEGFGLPGLEAMKHGAPVVSSNASCLPEVYGDAARYFDPADIPAMVKAINSVIEDESYRKELISLGHKQVDKYSWKRMAEQTLEVYKEALN